MRTVVNFFRNLALNIAAFFAIMWYVGRGFASPKLWKKP